MRKILKIALIGIAGLILLSFAGILYVVNFLPGIKVEEIKVEVTNARIERGKYLANHVTVCMDCHSTRDWSRFSGPLMQGPLGGGGELFDQKYGFPGSFISKNITPYNLKEWSDGELYRAITSGIQKNGKILFPVMPYTYYAHLDREDVFSIIVYLRSLESVKSEIAVSKTDFPMNIILHLIPQKADPWKLPDTANRIEYGRYLVNAAGCAECHTPFEKGKLVENMKFAGGREFPMMFGTVTSANITNDNETGIGSWSKDAFIQRFKAVDPQMGYIAPVVQKNDFNSIMPWTMYAGMKTGDLAAIYEYMRTIKGISNKVTKIKMNQ
jgi:mono/diheme cytochrome c family protein